MTKNEIMLGDLRGGLCSSGLCRQLRAVAAAELESLTADNALAIESLARQQAEIQRLTQELSDEKALGEYNCNHQHDRALTYMRERDRLRAALQEIADVQVLPGALTYCREQAMKALTPRQQDEPSCTCKSASGGEGPGAWASMSNDPNCPQHGIKSVIYGNI